MLLEAIEYYANIQFLEFLAVITALAYVVFASQGSLWCWPAAMISTLLYTYIFYDVYLWSDSALQVYYFAMAIYGWWNWSRHIYGEESQEIEIVEYDLYYHLVAITALSVISLIVGYFMANYTPSHFPYLDAATTVFAIFATYLVAKRVLENWLYWIVIDLVSIYLYQAKSLAPTAVLFGLYVILASYAYFQWRKMYLSQQVDDEFFIG
jgi:nicotinamide mononucleotide transporter